MNHERISRIPNGENINPIHRWQTWVECQFSHQTGFAFENWAMPLNGNANMLAELLKKLDIYRAFRGPTILKRHRRHVPKMGSFCASTVSVLSIRSEVTGISKVMPIYILAYNFAPCWTSYTLVLFFGFFWKIITTRPAHMVLSRGHEVGMMNQGWSFCTAMERGAWGWSLGFWQDIRNWPWT